MSRLSTNGNNMNRLFHNETAVVKGINRIKTENFSIKQENVSLKQQNNDLKVKLDQLMSEKSINERQRRNETIQLGRKMQMFKKQVEDLQFEKDDLDAAKCRIVNRLKNQNHDLKEKLIESEARTDFFKNKLMKQLIN